MRSMEVLLQVVVGEGQETTPSRLKKETNWVDGYTTERVIKNMKGATATHPLETVTEIEKISSRQYIQTDLIKKLISSVIIQSYKDKGNLE